MNAHVCTMHTPPCVSCTSCTRSCWLTNMHHWKAFSGRYHLKTLRLASVTRAAPPVGPRWVHTNMCTCATTIILLCVLDSHINLTHGHLLFRSLPYSPHTPHSPALYPQHSPHTPRSSPRIRVCCIPIAATTCMASLASRKTWLG